jgi:prepilin-type N-terminal cleavage/methylation domain-containing protein
MKLSSIPRRAAQAGFTLVEIAIVLVIVGLLLAGVLKGQELIENSRVKAAAGEMNGVSAAFNAYRDRFRTLPGDDGPNAAALQARGGSWANITLAGNNNGLLLVTQAQVFTGAGEGAAFWQALKAAGFITGNPADAAVAALPRNAFGGLIGVGAPVTGMTTSNGICLSQVPGKAARALDVQLDDGVSNAGSIRSTLGVTGANTNPGAASATYDDGQQYTLCREL